MSMDRLPGKFSRFDTQNNFPLKCCSAKSFLKTPIPCGLALPFHQLSGEKNNGNHESQQSQDFWLPPRSPACCCTKKKAQPLHDPKTATAEPRFGDFHQAMHPQRGLGILFLTQQILFGEIH